MELLSFKSQFLHDFRQLLTGISIVAKIWKIIYEYRHKQQKYSSWENQLQSGGKRGYWNKDSFNNKSYFYLLSLPQDTEAGTVLGFDLSLAGSGGAVCCFLFGQKPTAQHLPHGIFQQEQGQMLIQPITVNKLVKYIHSTKQHSSGLTSVTTAWAAAWCQNPAVLTEGLLESVELQLLSRAGSGAVGPGCPARLPIPAPCLTQGLGCSVLSAWEEW